MLSGPQLFEFGDKYRGRYDKSVGVVKNYYPSVSGYGDELLWAALWLHRATGRQEYLEYAVNNAFRLGGASWAISEFSWDIKYAGLQVLASKVFINSLRPISFFSFPFYLLLLFFFSPLTVVGQMKECQSF